MIVTFRKMVYEVINLSDYYLSIAKHNTFNYLYTDTVFAKIKTSDGTIKTIKHVN